MSVLLSVEILAIGVAALGIILALRGVRQQIQTDIFIRYTEKMRVLRDKKPKAFETYESIEQALEDDKVIQYLDRYFDLVFQEYQLRKMNSVSRRIWDRWLSGIRYYLRKDLVVSGWQQINARFDAVDPEFVRWVNQEIKSLR